MDILNIGKQIAAARALADWPAAELGRRAGMTKDAILKIEAGAVQPRAGTVNDIIAALRDGGVELTERGARFIDDDFKFLEGDDAYLLMLDDVYYATNKTGGEVLFFCADDRAMRPGEQELEQRIRAPGVRFRCLIEAGNDEVRWPRKEYRQIPSKFFNHNLQVIYGDKVAQMIDGGRKILIIRNASLATTARNIFDLVWSLMPALPAKRGEHG
jgi:transcriptional regulator with XRE-family HTH domain